jgi:hypothetical protein
MSSDPHSNASQLVLDDALSIVEAHALKDHVIDLGTETSRLMERHPDSKMTAPEIEAELIRLAAKHHVAVGLSGSDDAGPP